MGYLSVNWIIQLSSLAGALASGTAEGAYSGADAAVIAVQNNFLSLEDREKRDRALADQKAGKNLKEASQNIIYLTDKDDYTDNLLYLYGTGKLDEAGKLELAQYLDAYGTQLQLRGMNEVDALRAIETFLKYPNSSKPDLSVEYNKALGLLSTEERHAWQAAIGTDALLAGPGRISQFMRLVLISGGSYQTGTGLAKVADGKFAEGGINIGLGAAIVLGGYAGNKVVGKPNSGVIASKETISNVSSKKTSPDSSSWGAITDNEAAGFSYYDRYRTADGKWNWPSNLGFAEDPVKTILPVGARLDRYGDPNGSFLAPKGTPYEQRALAPGARAEKYYEYEVIKPLPVIQGKIAPSFGEPGGGIQILPNMQDRVNVQWLIDNKYIKEVKN